MAEKYLRTELIRAGDVILTRPKSATSKAIAGFTFGPFSHASLAIGTRTRFEALGDGIGTTNVAISRVEHHDSGRECRVLEDVSHYRRIAVFRHPALALITDEQVSNILDDIITSLMGLEYPELSRLAPASSESPVVRRIARRLLQTLSEVSATSPLAPGPFCSELVALFFARLEIELFANHREPDSVSPNDLARCQLREVPIAVCCLDKSKESDSTLVSKLNSIQPVGRSEILPFLVRGNRLIGMAEKLCDELDKFDPRV